MSIEYIRNWIKDVDENGTPFSHLCGDYSGAEQAVRDLLAHIETLKKLHRVFCDKNNLS